MKKSRRKSNTHREDETTEAGGGGGGDFAFNISKVAVCQICKSVGFRRSQGSALGTLTLVATKYMEALAKWAVSFSNAASRTQSNLLDLTNALHDLSLFQGQGGGFKGASTLYQDQDDDDPNNCLLKSSVLEALSGFVTSTVEMPFAKPIIQRSPAKTTQQEQVAVNNNNNNKASSSSSRGGHFPEWLPGFPPDHVGTTSNEKRDKKRVCGEELWENYCSSSLLGCPSNNGVEEDIIRNGGGGQLANKRTTTRVKFRINGGGGRGKRLHLNNNNNNKLTTPTKTIIDDDENEEEEEAQVESKEEEAQILVYKRRKPCIDR